MKTPRLTKKILNDEDALGLAIDAALLRSSPWRKLNRRVRKVQRKLRRMMTRDAWATYLQLEEIVNERAFVEGNVLVDWAFKSGHRSGR
jgi:hypothetical protein